MQPHITAIMVTGKSTDRYPLAMQAVESFIQQTYPHRRLLIINDHPTHWLLPPGFLHAQVQELNVAEQGFSSLGVLRNLGVKLACSTYLDTRLHYLMQWDDDDFSHPGRMAYQVMRTPEGMTSIFRWELHAHLLKKQCFANNGQSARAAGFAGTMLWPAASKIRFPAKGKHEDTDFILALKEDCGVKVIHNDPMMYLRFYHGANTWSEKHVMNRKPGSRDCNEAEQTYFNAVYAKHYEAIRDAQAGKP